MFGEQAEALVVMYWLRTQTKIGQEKERETDPVDDGLIVNKIVVCRGYKRSKR